MAGDIDTAMRYVADDVVTPRRGGSSSAAAFRQFIEPFSRILTGSHLHGAFGDETSSVLFYVADGKITHVRIVFDRVQFEAAREAAG